MNKFVVALLLVLAVTAQARKEKKGKTNKKDLTAKQIEKIDADLPKFETVAEALTESNLTALATTVESLGLLDLLNDDDFRGTILAPTDKAFETLLGSLPALPDVDVLTEIVLNHVVNNSRVYAAELKNGDKIETLAGKDLKVKIDSGKVFFVDETGAEAQVETADIKAGKSVIHVIDAVLLPGPVEAAVAAPSTAPPPKEGTATSSARGLFTSAAALATTLLAAALLA